MKFYCISVDKYVPSSAARSTQQLQQAWLWNSSFNLLMEVQWSNFQSAVRDLQSPFINGQEAISWRPKWRTQNFCCSFSSSYQGSSSRKSTLAMELILTFRKISYFWNIQSKAKIRIIFLAMVRIYSKSTIIGTSISVILTIPGSIENSSSPQLPRFFN